MSISGRGQIQARSSLDKLFEPQSIAVVGASNHPEKVGYQLFHALRGFPGSLFPINPAECEIQGTAAHKNILAIGQPIDLVILCIPAAACIAAVEQAAAAGAAAVLVTGGGFEETGGDGKELQNRLVDICRRHGLRLLGPNTAGIVNPHHKLAANFNPMVRRFSAGTIAVVSQSGAMSVVLGAMLESKGLGISIGVGIGNGSDISTPEVLEYLAGHERTKAIAVYLEGVADGRRLYQAIDRVTRIKPVVVYTVGRSDINEFAKSHTGKMVGSFAVKEAALIQAGAVVVSSSAELIDAAHALSHLRLTIDRVPGVGLLSGQAGPAMTIMDYLRGRLIRMPELAQSSIDAIARELPLKTFTKNPVDTARPDQQSFENVLSVMAADPRIDLLLTYAMHEPMCIDPVRLFRNRQDIGGKPMIFATSGLTADVVPTIRSLDALGIPAYDAPERAAVAAWALVEDARAARRKRRPCSAGSHAIKIGTITVGPDEAQSKKIVSEIGFSIPNGRRCADHEEALHAFRALTKPLAVKVLSAEVPHKTEVEGVHLHINSERALLRALKTIDAIGLPGEYAYLLEEMDGAGLDIVIGAKRDDSFGPVVLIGLGGREAEALADFSLRLAPLTVEDGFEMIDELKSGVLFDRWRGGPAYDKGAVAAGLVGIGSFMMEHPEVGELDLNPVRVHEHGAVVLDALIICR